MLLTTAIIYGILALALGGIGFYLEPPNPYVILFSAMFILLIFSGSITEGIDIKTGYSINSTEVNSTLTETQIGEIHKNLNNSDIKFNAFIILLILLFIYLMWFSVDEIFRQRRA